MSVIESRKTSTDTCPWCHTEFVEQRTSMLRITNLQSESKSGGDVVENWEHIVVCEKGHRFTVTMIVEGTLPSYRILVPTKNPAETRHKPVETKERCRGRCAGPILPGELYVGGANNPKHLGC